MALTKDTGRRYDVDDSPLFNELPVKAETRIFEGAAVGDDSAGYMRPLTAGDAFRGFAWAQSDNTTGSNGSRDVRLRQRGGVQLTVAGVTGPGNVGSEVYAIADDAFTLTSSGASSIGKVMRHVAGSTCIVRFEAEQVRSA